jgi:ribosomal protein S27E
MKIPFLLECDQCGHVQYIHVNLEDSSFETKCRTCGTEVPSFFGSNVTIGTKILWRSNFELLEQKDYSLSIVFSATAFECELTRLHFKWNQIRAIGSAAKVSDEDLESLLRKYRTIDVKMEKVSKLMDPRGFAGYVNQSPEFSKAINEGFPSLSLANITKDFQRTLFWPRNRVLHLADTSFSYNEARSCYNIAALGLTILRDMDMKRRSAR